MPVEADGAGAVARGSGFRFAFAFGAATACCFAAFFDDRPPGLATGGGAVLREANRQLLRERTHVIYLRVQPEEIYRRLRHDQQRPLLQVDDPKQKIMQLFEERDPHYQAAAHFVIETSRPRIPTMVNMIVTQLELAGLWPIETAAP